MRNYEQSNTYVASGFFFQVTVHMELHNQPGEPKHGIYQVRCTHISIIVTHNKKQKTMHVVLPLHLILFSLRWLIE
jgi:hypothetical protein